MHCPEKQGGAEEGVHSVCAVYRNMCNIYSVNVCVYNALFCCLLNIIIVTGSVKTYQVANFQKFDFLMYFERKINLK